MRKRTKDASIRGKSETDQTGDQRQRPSSPPRLLDVARERAKDDARRQPREKESEKVKQAKIDSIKQKIDSIEQDIGIINARAEGAIKFAHESFISAEKEIDAIHSADSSNEKEISNIESQINKITEYKDNKIEDLQNSLEKERKVKDKNDLRQFLSGPAMLVSPEHLQKLVNSTTDLDSALAHFPNMPILLKLQGDHTALVKELDSAKKEAERFIEGNDEKRASHAGSSAIQGSSSDSSDSGSEYQTEPASRSSSLFVQGAIDSLSSFTTAQTEARSYSQSSAENPRGIPENSREAYGNYSSYWNSTAERETSETSEASIDQNKKDRDAIKTLAYIETGNQILKQKVLAETLGKSGTETKLTKIAEGDPYAFEKDGQLHITWNEGDVDTNKVVPLDDALKRIGEEGVDKVNWHLPKFYAIKLDQLDGAQKVLIVDDGNAPELTDTNSGWKALVSGGNEGIDLSNIQKSLDKKRGPLREESKANGRATWDVDIPGKLACDTPAENNNCAGYAMLGASGHDMGSDQTRQLVEDMKGHLVANQDESLVTRMDTMLAITMDESWGSVEWGFLYLRDERGSIPG